MVGTTGVDFKNVAPSADAAANDAQHVGHGLHVFEVRDVRDFGYTIGKESRRHDGENGILCTRDFYFAVNGPFDLGDDKLIHSYFSVICIVLGVL